MEDKFKRVYHFNSSGYAIENLKRRRLKVATVKELNDPFELSAHNSQDSVIREALKKFKHETHARFGFLCFSRSWQSPVQWGHYAEKHQGICIGFDVPESLLYRIEYCDYRLGFDPELVETEEQKHKWSLGLLTTKYVHWSYEQEERAIVFLDYMQKENGLIFAGFDDLNIHVKEIIVGCNSKITRADVASALGAGAEGVKVFKARPSFGDFEIVRNRNEALWK